MPPQIRFSSFSQYVAMSEINECFWTQQIIVVYQLSKCRFTYYKYPILVDEDKVVRKVKTTLVDNI